MCIIIYRPADAEGNVTEETLRRLSYVHSDGYGLMWKDRGALRIWRSGPGAQGRKDWISRFLALQKMNLPVAAHGRQTTHGVTHKSMSHPYWVEPNKSALMHNGILPVMPGGLTHWSDTKAFVELVLKHLPQDWDTQPHLRYLLRHATTGSKLVVFFKDRAPAIINESSGLWEDGIWYSNTSFRATTVVGRSSYASEAWWQQLEEGESYPKSSSSVSSSVSGSTSGLVKVTEMRPTGCITKGGADKPVKLWLFEGVNLCADCVERELSVRERKDAEPWGTGQCELCQYGRPHDEHEQGGIDAEVDLETVYANKESA